MRPMRVFLQLATTAVVLAAACGQATALKIVIGDSTDNLVITSDSPNTHVTINGEDAFVSDPQILNNPGTGIDAELIEPPGGLSGLQPSSDAIGVIPLGADQFELAFNSDVEGGGVVTVNCSLPQDFACIPETGQPVDVGPIVYGIDSGVSVSVISDIDAVLEPSSLGILGSAVVGVMAFLPRRRARAAGAAR